jgi:hypothetical protein
MERSEILEMMTTLQLSGMRSTYDEIVSAQRASEWTRTVARSYKDGST